MHAALHTEFRCDHARKTKTIDQREVLPADGMRRCRSPYDDSAISSSATHQRFTASATTTALGQIVTATAWLSSGGANTACGHGNQTKVSLSYRNKQRPIFAAIGVRRSCAGQQNQLANVRFGSKADIGAPPIDVRFTPESGHRAE